MPLFGKPGMMRPQNTAGAHAMRTKQYSYSTVFKFKFNSCSPSHCSACPTYALCCATVRTASARHELWEGRDEAPKAWPSHRPRCGGRETECVRKVGLDPCGAQASPTRTKGSPSQELFGDSCNIFLPRVPINSGSYTIYYIINSIIYC